MLVACTAAPTPTPTAAPTALPAPSATSATSAVIATPDATPTSALPPLDTPAWFDDAVLYEIFVRSFYDSDGNGIGDLQGVIQQLDYLHDLGVTAIWLMPIQPSPSYHGYDITDYKAVNPDYGSEADLKALIQAVHDRDMRIILDYVAGHTSDQHPFFQDALGNPASEYSDWYHWLNAEHTQYLSFAGVKSMPSLNHENSATRDYLIAAARYYQSLGVDGLRCDYALGPPREFWQALRQALKSGNSDFLLLGEVWDRSPDVLARYFEGAFDALFDFPLYHIVSGDHNQNGDGTINGKGQARFLNAVILTGERRYPPGAQLVRFASNHDTNRITSEVENDARRKRLAALYILTAPGTPMVYYGEEIGMAGIKGTGHPGYDEYRREPMDWYRALSGPGQTTWFAPPNRQNRPNDGVSVEEQRNVRDALWMTYQSLIALRRSQTALRTGDWLPVAVTGCDACSAYWRMDESAAYLVALNFSAQDQMPAFDLSAAPDEAEMLRDALTGEVLPTPEGADYQFKLKAWDGRVIAWEVRQ
jgi:glycosidase